ncbi:NAD(P)-binding protein [Lentithecium fluviatile CBS 122367]|uniref:NAD(P)-binding protein n=1 Tax=Lentithecium fluviatile CBS 122367 TaxID=1168545 RepID=A0A6G1J6B1_9PLEO|nr:NAD(P)-binding protein [Lentithecium fluviatile CBS 122367]
MPQGLVLISGVNGYIAAVTAKHLLSTGYFVRGTVRNLSSATSLIEGPLKDYAASGSFTVVEVPDITVDGAFDEAVKGVTSILHLASPVSFSFTDPDPIIHAALDGTKSILNSALKTGPQLRSFVLLSSIAAIMNSKPAPYTLTESDWNDFAEAKVAELGTNTPGPVIYAASKVAAEKAFWKFREDENPNFAMVALCPVFVTGPPLNPPTTPIAISETIQPIWTIFSGAPHPPAAAGLGFTVDVRDIASLLSYFISHPKGTDGERYIAKSAYSTSQSIADVLRKAFPDAVGRIVEGAKERGYRADYQADGETQVDVDSGKARKLLESGEWIGYEKSVVDTTKSFVGLV